MVLVQLTNQLFSLMLLCKHYIISNRVICYGVYVGLEGHFSFLLSFIFMLFPILLFFFCSLISVLYIRAVSYSHFVNSLILPIYFFNFCPIYSALWFLPFFLRFERLLSWIYSWHFIYKRSFHFYSTGSILLLVDHQSMWASSALSTFVQTCYIFITLELRMEMANVSQRQQPD